jgi:hypothetical protein
VRSWHGFILSLRMFFTISELLCFNAALSMM